MLLNFGSENKGQFLGLHIRYAYSGNETFIMNVTCRQHEWNLFEVEIKARQALRNTPPLLGAPKVIL